MKESSAKHLRHLIAQHAARMLAEEGLPDYAQAKRKAAKQLGMVDDRNLPSNAEIEHELRLYHEIFQSTGQPQFLHQLRSEALSVMQLLERFNPYLSGAVLDGTAGRYAHTDIQLFVDSSKDIELFLLNHNIPYQMDEKLQRIGSEKRRLPIFVLEGPHGAIRLIVFATEDLRTLPKSVSPGNVPVRANTASVAALLEQTAS